MFIRKNFFLKVKVKGKRDLFASCLFTFRFLLCLNLSRRYFHCHSQPFFKLFKKKTYGSPFINDLILIACEIALFANCWGIGYCQSFHLTFATLLKFIENGHKLHFSLPAALTLFSTCCTKTCRSLDMIPA